MPDIPPPQSLFAGFGQATQSATLILSVPPPEDAPLPPAQSVFYSLVFIDTLRMVTLPPSKMLTGILAPSKLDS